MLGLILGALSTVSFNLPRNLGGRSDDLCVTDEVLG